MNRIEWLRQRQQGIGSSDAPNLIGIGYGDAQGVYRSKTQPVGGDTPKRGRLARGIACEPIAAAMYAEQMGVAVSPHEPFTKNPDRPWQFANLDWKRDDGRACEIKTLAGFNDDWGESGSTRIPDGYFAQVQHQMGCAEVESIDLAALDVIEWDLRVYRVAFDPSFFAWLSDVESRFWHEHVLPRVAPPPDWEEQFRDKAETLIVKEKRVELGPDALELIERRRELGTIRDEADEQYRFLTSRLTALMGDAERATVPGWNLKRTAVAGGEYTATRKPYQRLDIRAVKLKG
jgi:putative phage-type endonuclease